MRNYLKITKIILIILAIFGISASAMAAPPVLTLTNNLSNGSGFYIDYRRGGNPYAAIAGEFDITLAGFSSAAFCVELGVSSGSGNVMLTNPSNYIDFSTGSPYNYNGLHAAWLMDQYSTGLGFDYTGSASSKDIADAALQIAIWDTLYDYDKAANSYTGTYFTNVVYDLPDIPDYDPNDGPTGNGDGSFEEEAWILAEAYKTALNAVAGDGLDGDFSGKWEFFIADFGNLNPSQVQNLLVARAVPEPASLLLFGLGLLGLGAIGRKKV